MALLAWILVICVPLALGMLYVILEEKLRGSGSDLTQNQIDMALKRAIAEARRRNPNLQKLKNDTVPGTPLYDLNGVSMRSMRSSAVRAAGYDEFWRVLYVEFTSGTTYEYYNVPKKEYENFMNAESPGRFVNNVLTLRYEYKSIYC